MSTYRVLYPKFLFPSIPAEVRTPLLNKMVEEFKAETKKGNWIRTVYFPEYGVRSVVIYAKSKWIEFRLSAENPLVYSSWLVDSEEPTFLPSCEPSYRRQADHGLAQVNTWIKLEFGKDGGPPGPQMLWPSELYSSGYIPDSLTYGTCLGPKELVSFLYSLAYSWAESNEYVRTLLNKVMAAFQVNLLEAMKPVKEDVEYWQRMKCSKVAPIPYGVCSADAARYVSEDPSEFSLSPLESGEMCNRLLRVQYRAMSQGLTLKELLLGIFAPHVPDGFGAAASSLYFKILEYAVDKLMVSVMNGSNNYTYNFASNFNILCNVHVICRQAAIIFLGAYENVDYFQQALQGIYDMFVDGTLNTSVYNAAINFFLNYVQMYADAGGALRLFLASVSNSDGTLFRDTCTMFRDTVATYKGVPDYAGRIKIRNGFKFESISSDFPDVVDLGSNYFTWLDKTVGRPKRLRLQALHDHFMSLYCTETLDNQVMPRDLIPEPIVDVESGWTIFQPQSVHEVAMWGKMAHNCVASAGYYKHVLKKRRMLVFAKKGLCRYTVEFIVQNGSLVINQSQLYNPSGEKIDPNTTVLPILVKHLS